MIYVEPSIHLIGLIPSVEPSLHPLIHPIHPIHPSHWIYSICPSVHPSTIHQSPDAWIHDGWIHRCTEIRVSDMKYLDERIHRCTQIDSPLSILILQCSISELFPVSILCITRQKCRQNLGTAGQVLGSIVLPFIYLAIVHLFHPFILNCCSVDVSVHGSTDLSDAWID